MLDVKAHTKYNANKNSQNHKERKQSILTKGHLLQSRFQGRIAWLQKQI